MSALVSNRRSFLLSAAFLAGAAAVSSQLFAQTAPSHLATFLLIYDDGGARHNPYGLAMLHAEDVLVVNPLGSLLEGRPEQLAATTLEWAYSVLCCHGLGGLRGRRIRAFQIGPVLSDGDRTPSKPGERSSPVRSKDRCNKPLCHTAVYLTRPPSKTGLMTRKGISQELPTIHACGFTHINPVAVRIRKDKCILPVVVIAQALDDPDPRGF